jgi:hypothetical protein
MNPHFDTQIQASNDDELRRSIEFEPLLMVQNVGCNGKKMYISRTWNGM